MNKKKRNQGSEQIQIKQSPKQFLEATYPKEKNNPHCIGLNHSQVIQL